MAITIPPDLETKARISRKSKEASQTHLDIDLVERGASQMLTGLHFAKPSFWIVDPSPGQSWLVGRAGLAWSLKIGLRMH